MEIQREPVPRLPLLYEFAGMCRAGKDIEVSAEQRFQYCNRGNAGIACGIFPRESKVTAVRFDVQGEGPGWLEVLVIEEENHWPGRIVVVQFFVAESRFEPEIEDRCRRAQALHFCNSYFEWCL